MDHAILAIAFCDRLGPVAMGLGISPTGSSLFYKREGLATKLMIARNRNHTQMRAWKRQWCRRS